MDAATAMTLDGQRLFGVLGDVLWTLLRVGGLMMAAPLIGTRAVPVRVRLIFSASLALALTPLLPAMPDTGIDAAMVLNATREMALGVAMGFLLKLAFEAGAMAGELISQGTGLSFATLADPLRGQNTAVLGQWFYLAFGLLFFTMDGHLALIEMLMDSYRALPIGTPLPDPVATLQLVPEFFGQVLRAGVLLALPVMMALLAVNLVFGVLGRAAAALNPIALGLPAALLLGLVLLIPLISQIAEPVQGLFNAAFDTAAALTGG